MGEPVGIGQGAKHYPCAGNPNRPGAVLNDCPTPARWVVVGQFIPDTDGAPAVLMITACDHHLLGVKAWMRDRAIVAANAMGQPFTEDDEPLVDSVNNLKELEDHFGDSAWIANAG
jgi:hypothetical protein